MWRGLLDSEELTVEAAMPLFHALRRHGPVTLLVVASGGEPAVEAVDDGLLLGTLPEFQKQDNQAGPDMCGWVGMLGNAWLLRARLGHCGTTPVRSVPVWLPCGPDALEREDRLGLVFRDRSRAGEYWHAVIRGAPATTIDPAFLFDEFDRIRDFVNGAEAQVACDATLHKALTICVNVRTRTEPSDAVVRQTYGPDAIAKIKATAATGSALLDKPAHIIQGEVRANEPTMALLRGAEPEPLEPRRQVELARILLGAKKYGAAETAARRAVALQPDLVYAHDVLSTIFERQIRWGDAAAARRAAELTPQDDGRQRRLGLTLLRANDFAGAEQALRLSGRLRSGARTFHNHHLLGIVLERQGRIDEALVEARKASDLAPENPDLRARVAALLGGR